MGNGNILEWSDLNYSDNNDFKDRIKNIQTHKLKTKTFQDRRVSVDTLPKKKNSIGLHSCKLKRSKSEPVFENFKSLLFENLEQNANNNLKFQTLKEDNASIQQKFFPEVIF